MYIWKVAVLSDTLTSFDHALLVLVCYCSSPTTAFLVLQPTLFVHSIFIAIKNPDSYQWKFNQKKFYWCHWIFIGFLLVWPYEKWYEQKFRWLTQWKFKVLQLFSIGGNVYKWPFYVSLHDVCKNDITIDIWNIRILSLKYRVQSSCSFFHSGYAPGYVFILCHICGGIFFKIRSVCKCTYLGTIEDFV